jgi:hypothetical protein
MFRSQPISSRFRRCAAADRARRHRRTAIGTALVALLLCPPAVAQPRLTYRGFADLNLSLFPQGTPLDTTDVVAEGLLRVDPSLQVSRNFLVSASFDARADSHDQTARTWEVTFWDDTILRPALSVRRASATYSMGRLSLEVGKQFVRWGKADMMSPSDRFTPRDYLSVIDTEVTGVTAARITFAAPADSFEVVYTPRVTPSRLPLFTQRWAPQQIVTAPLPVVDAGGAAPEEPQYGARWNHTGRAVEYSASFFQGFDHQPLLDAALRPDGRAVEISRRYPRLRTYSGDLIVPLSWVAIRAEATAFDARDDDTDEYVLYVVQAERQWREWLFIGGYSGEYVTEDRGAVGFNADRGLAGTIIARAQYALGGDRSFILESITRHNGDGTYGKIEYSRVAARNLRVALRFVAIGGTLADYFGQYRRNSFAGANARYSF